MKTLKKINSIVIIFLLTGCFSNEENNILKMGKYYFHDRKCAHDYIILRENGTYEHVVNGKNVSYSKEANWYQHDDVNKITLENYQIVYDPVSCELNDTIHQIGDIQYHYLYGVLTLGDDTQYTHRSIDE